MNRSRLRALLLVLLSMVQSEAMAEPLRVAVAANFRGTMEDIGGKFTAQTSQKLAISSSATGVLVQQIIHGAPFDVLFSADASHIDFLEQRGLVLHGTRFTYAIGRLALWGPRLGRTPVPDDLANSRYRIGLANPEVAPYGIAAREALNHLGVWNPASQRLVRGNSVASVMQLASNGLVDLALVGRSQLQRFRGGALGADVFQIPEGWYAPLEQQVVILKSSRQADLARALLAWTASDAGRTLIQRDGYALPEHGRED